MIVILTCRGCGVGGTLWRKGGRWHIVEKGWQKHCPGERSVDGPFREPFKHLLKLGKKWINSWMKPGYCETEDKYHLSKVLLIHY
jgi:hypothetical protein